MTILIVVLLIFSLFSEGKCYTDRKTSNICDEIILQQNNMNPATCSSKFAIVPSRFSYTIDESIRGEL